MPRAGSVLELNGSLARSRNLAIEETLADVFGNNTDDYNRCARATSLDHGPLNMLPGAQVNSPGAARQFVAQGKAEGLALLRQAVRRLRVASWRRINSQQTV